MPAEPALAPLQSSRSRAVPSLGAGAADGLWKRPDLSARDRCIVTVAAVITRNQGILLPEPVNLALDNGVKPAELASKTTPNAVKANQTGQQL